jgi:hypothetical protein
MKEIRAVLLALALGLPGAADVLYDNTVLAGAITSIGPGQTCSPQGCVQSDHIDFDDVLVPVTRNPASLALAIAEVTVVITGEPFGSTPVSLWDFPVLANGSPGLPPDPIATTNVTFGASGIQQVAFGDGVSTLFTVQPNFTAIPGYDLFYLGLEGSSQMPGAAWAWANGPDFNLPTAYNYDVLSNTIFLNSSSPGFPPNFSYSLQVEGKPTVIPEPRAWILVATIIAGCGMIRRQYKSS